MLGTDRTLVGTYVVKVTGMDSLGGNTGEFFEFQVTVTDPCSTVTLSYPPNWPANLDEYSYMLGNPITSFQYLASDIILTFSNTVLSTCGDFDIVFTNRDGTPMLDIF